MAVEVLMPKMGMAMKEGTVSLWNKQVGDRVSKGEVIASISSEKIEADLEAPADGVPPGDVIGYIGHPSEQVAEEMTAAAAGLSIESLVGTGPQGRITKEDVEKATAGADVTDLTAVPPGKRKLFIRNDVDIPTG